MRQSRPPPFMTTVAATSGREALRESRLTLAAVVCAVAFAAVVGLTGSGSAALERAEPGLESSRTASVTRTPSGKGTRWVAGILHEDPLGTPVPASRDQVGPGGGHHRPATPFLPRVDSPRALLARYDARVLAQARSLLAQALPSRLSPLADRPLTVNCPAQGPPVPG
ncbi:hypothetical protein G4177_14540 [Corallococcus sp. ZKHCc1 1396]|uniref:Uncharacterized protein n=1 Tax=Corallococcus soli TaxID=2710757 RepID=A0ABR9PN84_9BACT|nr:hypothetical protein [Corallococcus soli]MBE4749383.1 hypothetical protein [Corallococcus soli]